MYKIGFIGSGNMAFALAKAINNAKLGDVTASDIDQNRLKKIKKLKVKTTTDNIEVVKRSNVIILAVKPQIMDNILDEIKTVAKNKLMISIAAGVTLKRLEKKLNKVVRVMPNTPCFIGEMAAGFAVGKNVTKNDIKITKKILNSAGIAFQLKESLLDAVTGLSGSGPAFVGRLIEAFTKAGIKQGLPNEVSYKLVLQTFKGTAMLLEKTGLTPEQLVNMVSSPGGTTIAGRKVMENSDYGSIIEKTVDKAAKRSRELGK